MVNEVSEPGEGHAALVGNVAPVPPQGPPEGFGVSINTYYNHYIAVADAKAAGFLTAALTVGAGALTLAPQTFWEHLFYWGSLALLSASGIAAGAVLFPRLPSGSRQGLIFWEDVRKWPTAAEYQQALSQANARDIEFAFATQNHTVSKVLHRKHVWVRAAILLFMVGTAAAAAALLAIRHA